MPTISSDLETSMQTSRKPIFAMVKANDAWLVEGKRVTKVVRQLVSSVVKGWEDFRRVVLGGSEERKSGGGL